MKVQNISIVLSKDYDPHAMIPKKWSEDFRANFIKNMTPLTWNINPDKYIVVIEKSKNKDDKALNRCTFGTFKKMGMPKKRDNAPF